MKNGLLNIISVILVISILGIIIYISNQELTVHESTLLSVLLTILSIIVSWVLASHFAKSTQKQAIDEVKTEYQNNLRTYALNAAEKVNNLSNELTKLALYLRSNLDNEDDSDEFAIYSKIERIESAIHIVNTLKSVNDTSLSDWKGVIGDELEEREEEREEREERLLELTEKIESIVHNQSENKVKPSSELSQIKEQLEKLSKTISPSLNLRTSVSKSRKEKIEKACPSCSEKIYYYQNENPGSSKNIKCASCEKRSVSKYINDKLGFELTIEKPISEKFDCPWCSTNIEKNISNIPFTKEIIVCESCEDRIKVTRKINMDLVVGTFGASKHPKGEVPESVEITPELLDIIEKALPEQPWPKFIHKEVADELNFSHRTVQRCIGELIKVGRCNPQIEGTLYVPKES
jgi:hypothetical protein